MLGRHGLTLMLALALAACQNGKQPLPTAAKGSSPAPGASHAASPAPEPGPQHLQKPAGGARTIAGTLTLDAGYMATVGVGRVAAGSYAVADAALVANNSGNIISEHGSGLISDNGGLLLSNNGGSLMTGGNSGTLISDNGSALTGKTKLGLLADAAPGLGAELPIGGMWVGVIALADGAAVPVGVDAAGKPVYVVHSDAKGRYELYLPPEVKGAVRVVAAVPDAKDGRLNYNLLVSPAKGQDDRFDEAAALTSDYVRRVLTGELVNVSRPTATGVSAEDLLSTLPEVLRGPINATLDPLVSALKTPDALQLSEARRQRAMQHAVDSFLADVDLSGMLTVPLLLDMQGEPEPAFAAAVKLFSELQAAATKRLAADPNYFATRPYMVEANLRRAALGKPPIQIRRPSDVGRFVVEEYTRGGSKNRENNGWVVATDLGFPATMEKRFHLVFESLYVGLAELLVQDEGARNRLEASEKAALAAERDLPEPIAEATAQPPITLAKEPAYDYATLADVGGPPNGLAVAKDGTIYFTRDKFVRKLGAGNVPADVASLGLPEALAVEPVSGKIYAADNSDHKIHEVGGGAFGPENVTVFTGLSADGQGGLLAADVETSKVWRINPADGSVKELAGAARADGSTPGSEGFAFSKPWGVAPGPGGIAYLSESGARRIWQLNPDGTPVLLAGLGEQVDPIDGFYIAAGFKQPYRMATAPDGSILVVDHPAGRLRRVRLQAGAGAVTTIDVPLEGLKDVAVGPDGTIYVILDFDPAIHTLKPRS